MPAEIYKNRYELAYHLMPEFDERELPGKVVAIEKIITQNGGNVLKSQEPKKKHLSYPIQQKHYANFGFMEFEAPTKMVEKINAQMKLENAILRFLLIESYGQGKILRSLTPTKRRAKLKTSDIETSDRTGKKTGDTEKESVQPEKMEQQIEDIIEKL